MHGTLDTFSVVEVLQMLGRVRRSGTLHIECPERQIDVHFVQGRIAETRDSTRVYADTVLGSLLIKRSLVTEEQLDLALREQESDPRPIGTILAQRGFVSEDDLREVLSRQVANTFLAVKTTGTNGTFMFVIDDTAERVDYITIDTQSVLIEVSSVGADYVAAFELVGVADTVLIRNRDYETLPRHPIPMGRDEFHVLGLIDDERTASEVAAASHLEEVTVVSILGKFCQAGVLLTAVDQSLTPRAGPELRAHRDSVWDEVSRIGEPPEPARDRAGAAACGGRTRRADRGAGRRSAARGVRARRPKRRRPNAAAKRRRSSRRRRRRRPRRTAAGRSAARRTAGRRLAAGARPRRQRVRLGLRRGARGDPRAAAGSRRAACRRRCGGDRGRERRRAAAGRRLALVVAGPRRRETKEAPPRRPQGRRGGAFWGLVGQAVTSRMRSSKALT